MRNTVVGTILKTFQDRNLSPDEIIDMLIIEGFTAIEQMIDCTENIKFIFSTYSTPDLLKISSNIITINGMIQSEIRKRNQMR